MENYLKIAYLSLVNDRYMYIDKKEYKADQIFINNELNVKFGDEFRKDDSDFCFVFVKVRKKDKEKFVKSMNTLDNLLLLNYGNDYSAFKKDAQKIFRREGIIE